MYKIFMLGPINLSDPPSPSIYIQWTQHEYFMVDGMFWNFNSSHSKKIPRILKDSLNKWERSIPFSCNFHSSKHWGNISGYWNLCKSLIAFDSISQLFIGKFVHLMPSKMLHSCCQMSEITFLWVSEAVRGVCSCNSFTNCHYQPLFGRKCRDGLEDCWRYLGSIGTQKIESLIDE